MHGVGVTSDPLQELTKLPRPELDAETKERLTKANGAARNGKALLNTKNPSIKQGQYAVGKATSTRRYFAAIDDQGSWPPQLNGYNKSFTNALEKIKRRHDGVVTTIGMLELVCLFVCTPLT